MNLPGFTAEVASSARRGIYRAASAAAPAGQRNTVMPAFGIDCYPMCVIFAEARCRRMCPPHSIDCFPMCVIMAENRCRRLCGVGGILQSGLLAGPAPVAPGDPIEGEMPGELMG